MFVLKDALTFDARDMRSAGTQFYRELPVVLCI